MKKVFVFRQSLMNGTVTMSTSVSAFTNRELAEQTHRDVIAANSQRNISPLHGSYSNVEEVIVYETQDEIPFYKDKGE